MTSSHNVKRFVRRRCSVVGVLLGMLCAAFVLAKSTFAHPLGNFSVNHYNRIELGPEGVAVLYVMDLAEIPTFQLKQKIDQNGDNRVDADEQQAYASAKAPELLKGVSLSLNGQTVALTAREPQVQFLPGQGGLDTLRLRFWMDAAWPRLGDSPVTFDFRNTNEVDRLGWREIVLRAKDGVKVNTANVSDQDVSDELRSYPQDLLNSPLKQTAASFSVVAQGGPGQVAGANSTLTRPAFGAAPRDSQFAALINYRDLTPSVILLSLLTALGLGALHALEPGHGKSVAAAYLVGTRATARHAVLLGGTVTVTHTASVFAMGLVTLFLSAYIVPEKLFPYLGLLSAGIVLAMGVRMIVNIVRQRKRSTADDHTHNFDPSTNQLVHTHSGKTHTHAPPSKLNARNVLAVGVSGGLVPCPAALIVLLSAIALGRVGFGMLLILAFSIGLAGVLVSISLAVLYGKRALTRSSHVYGLMAVLQNGRLTMALPMLSAMLVIGAGVILLYYALPFLRI